MNPEQYLQELYKHATSDAERRELEYEWRRLKGLPAPRSQFFPSLPPVSSHMAVDPVSDPREILRLMEKHFYAAFPVTVDEIKHEKPKPLTEEHMVAALVGHRAWNVPLFVDELRSVARASKWRPYQRFEADCEKAQCLGVSCSCGIYAFKTMKSALGSYEQDNYRSKRYVYGECWLWGRVLECKLGYRAQFAYPKSFVNSGAISKRMAEVFGVELTS